MMTRSIFGLEEKSLKDIFYDSDIEVGKLYRDELVIENAPDEDLAINLVTLKRMAEDRIERNKYLVFMHGKRVGSVTLKISHMFYSNKDHHREEYTKFDNTLKGVGK